MRYSLGLEIGPGMLLILGISLITTVLTFITKKIEFNVALFAVKLLHYVVFLISLLYIFVFDKKYDGLYVTLAIIVMVHWVLLKNECILSYIEKKILDKNYKLGDDVYSNPFLDTAFDQLIVYFLIFLQFLCYAFVIHRYFYKSYKWVVVLFYIYIAVMFVNVSKRFIKHKNMLVVKPPRKNAIVPS